MTEQQLAKGDDTWRGMKCNEMKGVVQMISLILFFQH